MEQGKTIRRLNVDSHYWSNERVLAPQEFVAAFAGYLNDYCGAHPELEQELREYFTEDTLVVIQQQHNYTNIDIAESFGATA